MKKIFRLFAFLSVFMTSATASAFGDLTRVEADWRCEQSGGGLAIQLPQNQNQGRVWQTEVGDMEGLELKVTDFQVFRCPGCFAFTAELMGMPVRGEVQNSVLIYELFNSENNSWQKVLDQVPCLPVK